MNSNICLKFWYGGKFKESINGKIEYVGGFGRTFSVDPNDLCWDFIWELAEKCCLGKKIANVNYLIPGQSLRDVLRKVDDEAEALEMAKLAMENKSRVLYVLHQLPSSVLVVEASVGECEGSPELTKPTPKINVQPKKLTPRRGPSKKSTQTVVVDEVAQAFGLGSAVGGSSSEDQDYVASEEESSEDFEFDYKEFNGSGSVVGGSLSEDEDYVASEQESSEDFEFDEEEFNGSDHDFLESQNQ